MNYEQVSAEEIAEHFGTISRQRVSQLILTQEQRGNKDIVAKMEAAKVILKETRHKAKYGYDVATNKYLSHLWNGMKARCGRHPAYLDCTVGFESIDHFKSWAVQQIGFNDKFELDKDILVKGNRVYSAETCVFVPIEVNSLLSNCYKAKNRGKYPVGVCYNKGSRSFVAQMGNGEDKYLGSFPTVEEAFEAYKKAKEVRIKELAEKWKDRIDPRAYAALMARTVELGD